MLEISDIADFARSFYGPLLTGLLSLLVITCLLDVKKVSNAAIDAIVGLFEPSAEDGSSPKGSNLVRMIVIIFIFFAWVPIFRALGNLAPFSVVFSPVSIMHINRLDELTLVGCHFLGQDVNSINRVAFFVWNDTSVLPTSRATQLNASIDWALRPVNSIKSMLVLFCLCGVAAWFLPQYRSVKKWPIFVLFLVFVDFSYATYSRLDNAVTSKSFALIDERMASIPIEARGPSACSEALRAQFAAPLNDTDLTIRIEPNLPSLSRLIPG